MAKKRRKKPRKGFTRSEKEWEESIARHIGKAVDRIDPLKAIIYGGLGYLGWKTFDNPFGALYGIVSFELAKSMNVVAGTSGVLGLVTLGLAQVPTSVLQEAAEAVYPPSFEPATPEAAEKARECYEQCMRYWGKGITWPFADFICRVRCGYPKVAV